MDFAGVDPAHELDDPTQLAVAPAGNDNGKLLGKQPIGKYYPQNLRFNE